MDDFSASQLYWKPGGGDALPSLPNHTLLPPLPSLPPIDFNTAHDTSSYSQSPPPLPSPSSRPALDSTSLSTSSSFSRPSTASHNLHFPFSRSLPHGFHRSQSFGPSSTSGDFSDPQIIQIMAQEKFWTQEISLLKQQLAKVTGERDQLRALADPLISRVAAIEDHLAQVAKIVPKQPSPVSLADSISPGLQSYQSHSHKDYPGIKYWTKDQWLAISNQLKTLSRGQKRGPSLASQKTNKTMRFIEHEDGREIDGTLADVIRKSAIGLWDDFYKRPELKLSSKWSQVGTTVSNMFCKGMETRFPMLSLCEDSWKAKNIATLNYPGWYKRRATNSNQDVGDFSDMDSAGEEDEDETHLDNDPPSKRIRVSTDTKARQSNRSRSRSRASGPVSQVQPRNKDPSEPANALAPVSQRPAPFAKPAILLIDPFGGHHHPPSSPYQDPVPDSTVSSCTDTFHLDVADQASANSETVLPGTISPLPPPPQPTHPPPAIVPPIPTPSETLHPPISQPPSMSIPNSHCGAEMTPQNPVPSPPPLEIATPPILGPSSDPHPPVTLPNLPTSQAAEPTPNSSCTEPESTPTSSSSGAIGTGANLITGDNLAVPSKKGRAGLVKILLNALTPRNLCAISFKEQNGPNTQEKDFVAHWGSIQKTEEIQHWKALSLEMKAKAKIEKSKAAA